MPLGRGLSSLLPQKPITAKFSNEEINKIDEKNRILQVGIEKIQLNPHQPRKRFDHSELEELIDSIKSYGIIQPLIATKTDDDKYQLIAGERRLRAAQILNLKTVPILVREAKEQEKLELALIENVQRKNLNSLEEAMSYKRLIDEFNLSQEEVGHKIGKKRSTITNTLRLLTLPEEIQKAILDEKITEGHARAIVALQNEKEQVDFLKRILRNQLSVRETENQVKKVRVKSHTRISKTDPIILEKEEKLRELLGHKVVIKNKAKGGEMIIQYNSQEDFNDIYKRLLGLE
ncbi:MAG: ParB/RepB/Spo0J family partition protein [Candidatus Parcubacteria bacterium]|nr:ParB/RepB/Spo0J family partition protein [Candidatus Parcubacteria bacterium]